MATRRPKTDDTPRPLRVRHTPGGGMFVPIAGCADLEFPDGGPVDVPAHAEATVRRLVEQGRGFELVVDDDGGSAADVDEREGD